MQLSLRSLLLAVSILACIFAVGAWATKDYRSARAIRSGLLSSGAEHVHVDVQGGRPKIMLTVDSKTSTTELAKYSHVDWQQVGIEGELNREMLTSLASLRNLRCLHFHKCEIRTKSDLKPLRNVKGVELLLFSNSSIDDEALDQLKYVPKLTEVVFHRNAIAPGAIEDLAASLPNVRVYETEGVSGATTTSSLVAAE